MAPVKCAQCGASIDPLALACTYCGFTTPAGVAAHKRAEAEAQARAAWEAQAQHNVRIFDRTQLDRSSTQALVWSIAGVAFCCLPLGVVGIVMGWRARSLARKLETPPPARATAGFVLGIVSCAVSAAMIVFGVVKNHMDQREAEERIAALEQRLGPGASAPVLDRETACGLAELQALRDGWSGRRGYALHGFECVGKLSTDPDRAQLDDFRFKSGEGEKARRYEVNVCLKRGARWYVSELREGPCPSK